MTSFTCRSRTRLIAGLWPIGLHDWMRGNWACSILMTSQESSRLGARCFVSRFGLLLLSIGTSGRAPTRLVVFGSESGLTSAEVSLLEIVHVGSVNGPVVASTVSSLSHLDKALVQRQIVANAVAPALVGSMLVVGKVEDDPVVDLVEQNLAVHFAQDGHRDQRDVAVWWSIDVTATRLTIQIFYVG